MRPQLQSDATVPVEPARVTAVGGMRRASGADAALRPFFLGSMSPTGRATLTIDHSAIAANLGILRAVSGVEVMGVVKADAFGLGAVPVARTLAANGVASFGVATIEEAIELRRGGLTLPILAWLAQPGADLTEALRLRIELSCSTPGMLQTIAATARGLGLTALVHLEADTGMNRGGASAADWPELCRNAAELEAVGEIRVVGVWSHLARADNPHWSAVAGQVHRFNDATAAAFAGGLHPSQRHLASSGAALAHPQTRYTLARCGAALYGIEPVEHRKFGLHPVVRVSARVQHVRRVAAGSSVGYGPGHLIEAPTTLALIPLGYADGVPRSLASTGWLGIAGRRFPIVGAVSMDQVMVDVGDSDVRVGDEAVLVGDPQRGEPSLAEVAAWAGTIPQEILTNLGSRFETIRIGAPRVA